MHRVNFHCTAVDRAYAENALKELSELLEKAPARIEVEFVPLSEAEGAAVEDVLKQPFPCFAEYVSELSGLWLETCDRLLWPLLVFCPRNCAVAEAARRSKPLAQWGAATGNSFAAVWQQDKYVVWHEALHLLSAEDCYTEDDMGPTCEQRNCIMQWVPTEQNVGQWPFLCSANIRRICDFSSSARVGGQL